MQDFHEWGSYGSLEVRDFGPVSHCGVSEGDICIDVIAVKMEE